MLQSRDRPWESRSCIDTHLFHLTRPIWKVMALKREPGGGLVGSLGIRVKA
jgi:hypothetical protein